MKFFIVLLAILKYALIVILFLLLLVLVLALILMVSPIKYKAVVNYKDNKFYYNIDVTYLGNIVAFQLRGVKTKFKAYVRLLHKKVYIKSDDKQKAKKQTDKKTKSTSTSKSKKSSSDESLDDKISKTNATAKKVNLDKTIKENKSIEPNIALNVAQKITPTTTLEEETKTNLTDDIHNSKGAVIKEINIKDNCNDNCDKNNVKDLNKHKSNNSETTTNTFSESKGTVNKDLTDTNVHSREHSNKDSKKESYKESYEESNEESNEEINSDRDEDKSSFFGKTTKFINTVKFYIESYKTYPYRDKLFVKFKKIFTNLKDALFPKVFDCSGEFYIHSPSTTGQILAILYILHGLNKTFNVDVDADYETEKTNFTALISGRIIIFKLVQPVVSFVWLGLKAEAKRRGISRFKLIKILINNE